MKFVLPEYQVLKIPEPTNKMGVLKYLERIGRVCYKSEDKITDDSCIKYLQMIRDRKHWAMLEHYIFNIEVPDEIIDTFDNLILISEDYPDLAKSVKYIDTFERDIASFSKNILSASATAINYLWEAIDHIGLDVETINPLFYFMYQNYPEITKKPDGVILPENLKNEVDGFRFIPRSKIRCMDGAVRLIHDWMSVKFICDRGYSHELVRHRPCSFAQESTRYVNYGKHGCQFILPFWLPDHDKEVLLDEEKLEDMQIDSYFDINNRYKLEEHTISFLTVPFQVERAYNELLKASDDGNEVAWTPQQARSVLPNTTKTEIVLTTRLHEWKHIFDMRAEHHAHPQMLELMVPLLAQCIHVDPVIFKDQMEYIL